MRAAADSRPERIGGQSVGIYSEIKHPQWHREHGVDLSSLLLAKLQAFGYSKPEHAAFVQCFDADELLRVRNELGCALRLIQLVDSEPPTQNCSHQTASGV